MSNSNSIGKYYNDFAGKNTAANIAKDAYGNISGSQYDLAKDGAFAGKTVAILNLHKSTLDFSCAIKSIEEKGFSIIYWHGKLPSHVDFKLTLSTASQLWVISAYKQRRLNRKYLKTIIDFFNEGRGLFLWGENKPIYYDTNYIAKNLFGVTMSGDTPGRQKVTLQKEGITNKPESRISVIERFKRKFFVYHDASKAGIVRNHPITTGLEVLYEGATIATITENQVLTPIMYGSAGNLVTACYDKDGKRAIIDGGFTRLDKDFWDTAGTARFVKNAAAWLANVEIEN